MERYYIRHATGQIFGPFDRNAIRLMVKNNKIALDVQVSPDQVKWETLSNLPDLYQSPAGEAHTSTHIMTPGGFNDSSPLPGIQRPSADLPQSKSTSSPFRAKPLEVDLPGVRAQQEPALATAISDSDFPTQIGIDIPGQKRQSPQDSWDDDDLFGSTKTASEDDLFQTRVEVSDDDLFNTRVEASVEDELFDSGVGEPSAPKNVEDDLFGAPSSSSSSDEDDLFGAAFDADDDDLFADPLESVSPPPSHSSDNTGDFLSGEQAFSFLDDKAPLQTPQAPSGSTSMWVTTPGEEQIEQWDNELRQKREKTRESSEQDPRMPASRGIQSDTTASGVSIWEDEVIIAKKARAKIKLMGTVAALGMLLIVGGVSYFFFFPGSEPEIQEVQAPTVRAFTMQWSDLGSHNYTDYQAIIHRSQNAQLTPTQQGQLLLVQSLFLAHYDDGKIAAQAEQHAGALADKEHREALLGLGAYEAIRGDNEHARSYLDALTTSEDQEIAFYAHLLMGIGDIVQLYRASMDTGDESGDEGLSEGMPQQETYTILQRAAELKPNSALPHYWIAQWQALRQDPELTLDAHVQAVEADPMHVGSRLSLGYQFHQRWQLNLAEEQLKHLIDELQSFASRREKADAYHLLGMLNVARVHNEMAIEMLSKAIEFDINRPQTLLALSDEFEQAREFNAALRLFSGHLKPDSPNAELLLGVARAHMGLEQWDEAINFLAQGKEAFPEDARFPYYTGRLHLLRGAFNDARRALTNAIETDPTALAAYATLAQLAWRIETHANRGEEHIARIIERAEHLTSPVAVEVASYYRMSEQETLAQKWYEEAIALDANYWPARVALVQLFLAQGENDRALEMLQVAREEGVLDIRLPAYLADAFRQAKQFDRAMEHINDVIERYPTNEEFLFIRGRIHFDQRNFDLAREDFNRAYEINPLYHETYFFVGRTALEQNDFNSARRIFRHVLDYQPNNGEYHYYMGRTFEQEDAHTQALDQYRRATTVDPRFGVQNPEVFVRRGRILSKLGYFRESKRDISQALELNPGMLEARIAMGETEFRDRNYSDAIQHFRQAIRHAPDNANMHYYLGMSFLYTNNRQEAIKHLRLAVEHQYDNPDIYRTMGYLYKDLNQRHRALEAFRTYLRETAEQDIPNTVRREMLRQIRELGG